MAVGVLAACATPSGGADEGRPVCAVEIQEQFGTVSFQPPSGGGSASGAVRGAAAGMLQTLPYAIFLPYLLPLGALVGAAAGTSINALENAGTGVECVTAALNYPEARADFDKLFDSSDLRSLRSGIEKALSVPRPACAAPPAGAAGTSTPDAVIEIRKIEITPTCAFGNRQYWVDVEWRAIAATSRQVVREARTSCLQTSSLGVGAWAADPQRARQEVARVLDRTGHRMATELLAADRLYECRFRSVEGGEVEERARGH